MNLNGRDDTVMQIVSNVIDIQLYGWKSSLQIYFMRWHIDYDATNIFLFHIPKYTKVINLLDQPYIELQSTYYENVWYVQLPSHKSSLRATVNKKNIEWPK